MVRASRSAWVGCSCGPSPALTTEQPILLGEKFDGACRVMAHDQEVRAHGVQRHRGVDERLPLLDRGAPTGMFMTSAPRRLPATRKRIGCASRLRRRVDQGAAAQKRLLLVGLAAYGDHSFGEVEQGGDFLGRRPRCPKDDGWKRQRPECSSPRPRCRATRTSGRSGAATSRKWRPSCSSRVQGPKGPRSKVQGPKGPRSKGYKVQGPRSKGSKVQRSKGSKGSKGSQGSSRPTGPPVRLNLEGPLDPWTLDPRGPSRTLPDPWTLDLGPPSTVSSVVS